MNLEVNVNEPCSMLIDLQLRAHFFCVFMKVSETCVGKFLCFLISGGEGDMGIYWKACARLYCLHRSFGDCLFAF